MISLTMEGFEQANLIYRLQAELETSTKATSNLEQDATDLMEKQPSQYVSSSSPSDSEMSEEGSLLLQHEGIRQRRPVA